MSGFVSTIGAFLSTIGGSLSTIGGLTKMGTSSLLDVPNNSAFGFENL